MEQNIMEEVAAKISLITLEKAAADKNDYNFKEFLEEICCKNKRVECSDHFLNNALMVNLVKNLKSGNLNRVYGTVVLIAEMAKNEVSRHYLGNIYLVGPLLDEIKGEGDYFIRLQACRALANMCYEDYRNQNLIIKQNPLENIFALLDLSCTPCTRENNERFKEVVVALILNLLEGDQDVAEEVADKYVPSLVKALKCDLENQIPTAISHNIFVAIISLTEVNPPENIFTLEVCLSVVDMYRRTSVFDYSVPGLEFLADSKLPDIAKYHLVRAGLFDVFMCALEHKPEDLVQEKRTKYEPLGRVLANILSGDEAMAYVYDINNAEVINRFGAWLLSRDKDMVHTGALCLGNVARTDSNCLTIVERGIHKNLIRVVQENRRDLTLLYATVSTLRNLCLPKTNKKKLVDDGMVEALLPLLDLDNLDVRISSPVIYKAIGAIGQAIEGQEDIIIRLGTDANFVRQLVKWSTATTVLAQVSIEFSRFLCSLVNKSKDRNVIINMIENGAYVLVSRMLTVLHGSMNSDALTCMTVTVNAALNEAKREDLTELSEEEKKKSDLLADIRSVLAKCELAKHLRLFIVQHGVKIKQQVLEECFTFLEEAIKIEPLRHYLYHDGLIPTFHCVMCKRSNYEEIKTRITEIENACKFC